MAFIDIDIAIERYEDVKNSVITSERHRVIFEERFGDKTGAPKTLSEIGKKFNIAGTRVRQICAKVLFMIGIES